MKKSLLVILLILGVQFVVKAQKCDKFFTIYLVRHAEKDFSTGEYYDPPLTNCGEQRAEYYNQLLNEVPLEAIYSTDYTRTKSTASPTAISKGLSIENYEEYELEELSELLLKNKQDALVVGHSYTTGVLAGFLVDEEIGAYDLSIYNRVYQVVVYKNSKRLHLLHTSFDCND